MKTSNYLLKCACGYQMGLPEVFNGNFKRPWHCYLVIKRRYWIVCFVVAARVFVSRLNCWFLLEIPVFICRHVRVLLQMVLFLIQYYLMGLCPWHPSRLSFGEGVGGEGGGHAKIGGGVASNGWVRAGGRDLILARDIYCANPNPKPDAQSGTWWKIYKIINVIFTYRNS